MRNAATPEGVPRNVPRVAFPWTEYPLFSAHRFSRGKASSALSTWTMNVRGTAPTHRVWVLRILRDSANGRPDGPPCVWSGAVAYGRASWALFREVNRVVTGFLWEGAFAAARVPGRAAATLDRLRSHARRARPPQGRTGPPRGRPGRLQGHGRPSGPVPNRDLGSAVRLGSVRKGSSRGASTRSEGQARGRVRGRPVAIDPVGHRAWPDRA